MHSTWVTTLEQWYLTDVTWRSSPGLIWVPVCNTPLSNDWWQFKGLGEAMKLRCQPGNGFLCQACWASYSHAETIITSWWSWSITGAWCVDAHTSYMYNCIGKISQTRRGYDVQTFLCDLTIIAAKCCNLQVFALQVACMLAVCGILAGKKLDPWFHKNMHYITMHAS